MRVLVLDDDEDYAFLVCELIKKLGCESRFCNLPDSSIEVATLWQPKVILLDLAMPGTDGYSLAPKLREAVNGSVMMILLSGYVPDELKVSTARIDAHLLKPVALNQLKRMLPC